MSIQQRLRLALVALVALQLGSWPLAMLTAETTGVSSMPIAVLAYVLIAATMIALATFALSGKPVRPLAIPALAVGVVALVLGGLATEPASGTGYSHPTLAVAVGLALLLALEISWAQTALAVVLLVVAYLVGIVDTLKLGSITLTSLATNVATLAGVPLVGGWLARALVDLSASRAAHAESSALVRRNEARETERSKQYRLLHDTVLSTLSALSRGGLDVKDPAVSQRLAADADYLRGLIATSSSGAGMFLVGELARMTREHAAAGLRVHQYISEVPDELPPDVGRALTDSVYEALTNVVKHSGRREAWVTIVGSEPPDGKGVLVTVTDQGAGFDTRMPHAGFGISRSLVARMADIGGMATIDSAPGQGTSVELRWPA